MYVLQEPCANLCASHLFLSLLSPSLRSSLKHCDYSREWAHLVAPVTLLQAISVDEHRWILPLKEEGWKDNESVGK